MINQPLFFCLVLVLPLRYKAGATKVAVITLFRVSSSLLAHVLGAGVEGIVLMTYGMGNVPSQDRTLLKLLAKASDQGLW